MYFRDMFRILGKSRIYAINSFNKKEEIVEHKFILGEKFLIMAFI
jgi:hypothetical protein